MRIGKPGPAISHIAQAHPDRVEVRGRDLAGDLMGRLSFTEYFHLLLTGDEPTEEQRFFLDLLLVAIAEHGMMPTNVAARMTLSADPDSLQGAVAAGILGCGPVILGTAKACARLLVQARGEAPAKIKEFASMAREAMDLIAAIGAMGSTGHVLMTHALKLGDVTVIEFFDTLEAAVADLIALDSVPAWL